MHSVLGTIGPVGLAVLLTVILIVGTTSGGKVKPLGWGWALFLSVLAGASYAAADWPFSLVRGVVRDLVALSDGVIPGLTLPAIGLSMLAIILWQKMTTRGVVMMGIPFWYIAASANGGLGILADKIAQVSHQLAS
ncbi:hypothetical protein PH213_20490 [Streptomyces sp. SRF1]|uniref:hypothetical protein n=1 Tax=Streptomyces sp. SRF1 TaxID=1549642 RepID=UPI0025B24FA2|nr:hypothetical protein [Streptomyces sp. SRF1]MDN3056886.1 hypothetical protein [Streptomyces sp. SRF1]